MNAVHLLHHLVHSRAEQLPEHGALSLGDQTRSYAELAEDIDAFCASLLQLGLARGERVATYLDKCFENVTACFGCSAAGGIIVALNPLLRPRQVGHILQDCSVRVLLSSPQRFATLQAILPHCPELRHVIVTTSSPEPTTPPLPTVSLHDWESLRTAPRNRSANRVIDSDLATLFYTSGSTGRPKGVMLSHRNLLSGAHSVASYLGNHRDDILLAALPLSFDAGFSQLTTAFYAGARVVLLNYLLPQDVLKALAREGITGMTAVPPLWIQLAQLHWPDSIAQHLRYFASTGGHMPQETLSSLRAILPRSRPFLMYGLTEAFRATFLPPSDVDTHPGSIGKAIPNAEILVLREDGCPCAANEPGELVQRGALVAQGYWNNPQATAERFRPLPPQASVGVSQGVLPEIVVFSGDTVRMDEEGYLYFISRRDDLIKSSGYRISPTEVEEVLYSHRALGECIAFGVPDPKLGEAIHVIAVAAVGNTLETTTLLAHCRKHMPAYMLPHQIDIYPMALPRNPNGKIDRKTLIHLYMQTKTAALAPKTLLKDTP